MFDWEHGIALQALQGYQDSSPGKGEVSCFFSSCGGNRVIFTIYGGDDPSKPFFDQRNQDSCLVMRDTSGISTSLGRAIWTLLELRSETKNPFLVATVIF